LASFSSQAEEKKEKHKEKENHRGREMKELTFLLSLLHLR
jgi:hypothetical protein